MKERQINRDRPASLSDQTVRYDCSEGDCFWSDWSDYSGEQWEGAKSLKGDGTIGLLLDLDEGTLTVYKNGRRLGVMKSGLSGEYCWFVSMYEGDSTVSIERGTLP